MKLKRGRRELQSAVRARRAVPSSLRTGEKPASGNGELYGAIRRAYGFLHGGKSPEGLMEKLAQRYPSPRYLLEANRRALEAAGLSRLDAFYYAMIPDLARTSLSQQWGAHPRLDKLSMLSEYLRTLYLSMHVECFYAVLLNREGVLIRPVLLQRGELDNTPFYLGQVLTCALQEDARYLALAHNHPRGTLRPSREDLGCTLRALNALASLGIPLLDHLIVAGEEVTSIRRSGLLPDILWTAANPDSAIIRDWLS